MCTTLQDWQVLIVFSVMNKLHLRLSQEGFRKLVKLSKNQNRYQRLKCNQFFPKSYFISSPFWWCVYLYNTLLFYSHELWEPSFYPLFFTFPLSPPWEHGYTFPVGYPVDKLLNWGNTLPKTGEGILSRGKRMLNAYDCVYVCVCV